MLLEINITFFSVVNFAQLADDVQRRNTRVNNNICEVEKTAEEVTVMFVLTCIYMS